ncbi:MAG: WD40 repeat domain-containing protein [Gemmataceae bacterium]
MRVYQAHDRLRVSCVRFAPDARTLTVAVSRHHALVHFDCASGEHQIWRPGLDDTPTVLTSSPDGGILVVGCRDGSVYPFRVTDSGLSGDAVRPFRHIHAEPLARLRVVDHTPGWRLQGRPIWEVSGILPAGQVTLSAVSYSPSTDPSRMRLAAAGTHLYIWNAHTQEYIVGEDQGDYRGASFGPDGSFVVSIEAHVHCLTVWDVKPFRVRFRTELAVIGEFANGAVAVLPDGDRIVYAAGDQLRCVSMSGGPGWEATLKRPAVDLALHPNGHTLFVADGSKRVTQFDTDIGRPMNSFDWGIGKVSCVDVSRDGTLAAAGGEKGQVVVWDAE